MYNVYRREGERERQGQSQSHIYLLQSGFLTAVQPNFLAEIVCNKAFIYSSIFTTDVVHCKNLLSLYYIEKLISIL